LHRNHLVRVLATACVATAGTYVATTTQDAPSAVSQPAPVPAGTVDQFAPPPPKLRSHRVRPRRRTAARRATRSLVRQTFTIAEVWYRVAECESSGDWHINTGNGFYGGLQFTAGTWLAYRPQGYPNRADYATPVQQVIVAKRVLLAQGVHAWPVCGPRAGLTLADAR